MADYFNQYNVRINKKTSTPPSKLQIGDIIMFKYTGENVNDDKRIVFVLNPRWNNKLHGIVLNKIQPMIFWFFYHNTLKWYAKDKSAAKQFMTYMSSKMPKNAMAFYSSKIKPWLLKNPTKGEGSPYRTYNLQNMNVIRKVEWK